MSFFDLDFLHESAASPSLGGLGGMGNTLLDNGAVPFDFSTPTALSSVGVASPATPAATASVLPQSFQWDLLLQQGADEHDDVAADIEHALALALPATPDVSAADSPLLLKKPLVVPADMKQAVAKATAGVVAEQRAAAPEKRARDSAPALAHATKKARVAPPTTTTTTAAATTTTATTTTTTTTTTPKRRAAGGRKRRKKSSGDEAYLTPRQKHLKIEKRRRENINTSLARLREMVPTCEDGDYKSVVLEKTVDHMEELRDVAARAADALSTMLRGSPAEACPAHVADVLAALRDAVAPQEASE